MAASGVAKEHLAAGSWYFHTSEVCATHTLTLSIILFFYWELQLPDCYGETLFIFCVRLAHYCAPSAWNIMFRTGSCLSAVPERDVLHVLYVHIIRQTLVKGKKSGSVLLSGACFRASCSICCLFSNNLWSV